MNPLSTQTRHITPARLAWIVAGLSLLLLVVTVLAMSFGSVSIPPGQLWQALTGETAGLETERSILLDIRLPRILLAILVGAGLSMAGTVFQALLRNPLAEPYILGISSGGTVGAVLALGLGVGALGVSTASFAGSLAVMSLVYAVAHRRGQLDTYTLLLAGVMIGAFFTAVILLLMSFFSQELRNAFLWLMGNLGSARLESLAIVAPPVALAMAGLLLLARRFNLIATGDETAMQLGVDVVPIKRISYLLASLITGLVVSVSGIIGFVGLIIPHICRILFGPDHRVLLPSSALVGGTFLLLADLLARTLVAPAEIPVGAVTAALGAPLFIYLLRRS